jgi:hypothetical protein
MTSKTDMNKTIKALEITLKWKHYRDTHYRLYEATKDICNYKKSIAAYQCTIKSWMQKHNQQIVPAINALCNQNIDAIMKIKFICAGYDLAAGLDYDAESSIKNPVSTIK